MFIGRERELKFFEDKYNAPGGQLVVLYGRRRIGKTETLFKFAQGKPHVFYSCRELSDSKQHAAFMERMLKSGIPARNYSPDLGDWESAFKSVLELPSDGKKKLLIIDEFPYMCKGNPSIPSILQILWDEGLRNQDVMIVLCGSAMSFIENKILSEKKPLYGRATGIYKMNDLPFDDAIKFFPNYSDEDKMLAYAILGGIPHYLRQFDPTLPLRENIIKNVLTKGCVLYNEVEFLIRQELREPAFYNTVIEAIALGNTQLNDIYMKTRLDKAKISVYLKNLMELRILEREFSALAGDKEQATSTRGLYRITDNFFRFWFSFVSPNLSDLETDDAEGVFTYAVRPQINNFASAAFEAVCRSFIREKNRLGELPFRVSKLGRWWGKLNQTVLTEFGKEKIVSVETEIDIVAVDAKSKNYIIGECKFRDSEMDVADLAHLKEKSSVAKKGAAIQYALFSKSGFSKGLTARASEDETIKLFSLADIVIQTF
ncbi:MAG: AAA family ATPase [Peptococcaceae bacterium]|jgi:AAA+ ATPase superfamily predicted ATPase|nr:AAA family ATPase [Peptococcaceae bacterium]